MTGKIVRWLLWLVLVTMALSFAPTVARMDHEQQTFLGALLVLLVAIAVLSRNLSGGGSRDDENAELLWRRNADRFRD